MQRLGPYTAPAVAQSVARQFRNLGEVVQIEEVFEPLRKGSEYQAFVIRAVSA